MPEFPDHSSEPSVNQFIGEFAHGCRLFLKREDLLHPEISGNKFRKLKYNLQQALAQGEECLLTFGGAYSNHIAATAAAGKIAGVRTIGVIRGEELGWDLEKTLRENSTLAYARRCGMQLEFISRSRYREKASEDFIEGLKYHFGNFYLVPEGGTNALAVRGCEEILAKDDKDFEFTAVAVGTGGTLAGLSRSAGKGQKILGFPALKGDFLSADISRLTHRQNWELISGYNFGGYARVNLDLINFINEFQKKHQILLDPMYTGKLVFGIFDLLKRGCFPPNSRILMIHTGGLQGVAGFNKVLKKKNLPLIKS